MLVLVLVCGIPGSGKSSFSSSLCNKWNDRGGISDVVSFDELDTFEEWNESTFGCIRKDGYERLRFILGQADFSGDTLIIVDDIMYLRSMRRDVYKLTRQFRVPLLTVRINTSLQVALDRNSTRQGRQRIPEETIDKIYHRFECPSSTGSIVDRYRLIIDGNTSESMAEGVTDCIARIYSTWSAFTAEQILFVSPTETIDEAKTVSFIGRLDDTLRKIISAVIQEFRASKKYVDLTAKLGKILAEAKTATLKVSRKLNLVTDDMVLMNECQQVFADEVERIIMPIMSGSEAELITSIVCNQCS